MENNKNGVKKKKIHRAIPTELRWRREKTAAGYRLVTASRHRVDASVLTHETLCFPFRFVVFFFRQCQELLCLSCCWSCWRRCRHYNYQNNSDHCQTFKLTTEKTRKKQRTCVNEYMISAMLSRFAGHSTANLANSSKLETKKVLTLKTHTSICIKIGEQITVVIRFRANFPRVVSVIFYFLRRHF